MQCFVGWLRFLETKITNRKTTKHLFIERNDLWYSFDLYIKRIVRMCIFIAKAYLNANIKTLLCSYQQKNDHTSQISAQNRCFTIIQ